MMQFKWGNVLEATLSEDLEWTATEPAIAKSLNVLTEIEMENIGPADGDPRAAIFYRLAEIMQPDEVVFEPEERPAPAGRVY